MAFIVMLLFLLAGAVGIGIVRKLRGGTFLPRREWTESITPGTKLAGGGDMTARVIRTRKLSHGTRRTNEQS
jgi:hypothetical protein